MKYLVVSDLHGSSLSATECERLLKSTQADKMLMLGDYLYHGPRNPLPEHYDPKTVIATLNPLKEKIVGIRGNCDSEVDQMVLEFPMMADYVLIQINHRRIFATHGHVFHPEKLPSLNKGDVFLFGHIHIPVAEKQEEIYLCNPGSITLPKMDSKQSYGILDETHFAVYDLSGTLVKEIMFD